MNQREKKEKNKRKKKNEAWIKEKESCTKKK